MKIYEESIEALEGMARNLKKQADDLLEYNGGLDGSSIDIIAANLIGTAAIIDRITSSVRESDSN